jgi:hypothetical protein
MTTKRRSYAATYARSDSARSDTDRRRTTTPRRKRSAPARQKYGAIFFVVMGVTIASAIGFMGVVASVMAGS